VYSFKLTGAQLRHAIQFMLREVAANVANVLREYLSSHDHLEIDGVL
jgi:hypothetical protein